jgi:hypothetical protein
MEEYKFNPEYSKMIVDAIVSGYHDYIDHRKDRKEKMKISSAFAWTKGNFIESKIAEECIQHGFTYKKSRAGLTWDYLQFIHGETKILFLIKNAAYFNKDCFSLAKMPTENMTNKTRTYLHELSKINNGLKFPTVKQYVSNQKITEQIELPFFVSSKYVDEELKPFRSYKQFHILTYKLDEAYQIAEIIHYLPNPDDNIAYVVEDLSYLIAGAELTDDEREIIAPEGYEDILEPAAYDIGIQEEEEHRYK